MSIIRKLSASAAVIFTISSPALADSWSNNAVEPKIYQTNSWNGPSTIASIISSTTAVITKISFNWGYSYTFNSLNPTYTISGAACWNQNATICTIGAGSVTGGSVSNSTELAGKAANKAFDVYTNAVSSTTKTFAARPIASQTFALTVNYSE